MHFNCCNNTSKHRRPGWPQLMMGYATHLSLFVTDHQTPDRRGSGFRHTQACCDNKSRHSMRREATRACAVSAEFRLLMYGADQLSRIKCSQQLPTAPNISGCLLPILVRQTRYICSISSSFRLHCECVPQCDRGVFAAEGRFLCFRPKAGVNFSRPKAAAIETLRPKSVTFSILHPKLPKLKRCGLRPKAAFVSFRGLRG